MTNIKYQLHYSDMRFYKRTFFFSFLSSSLILITINLATLLSFYYISNHKQFDSEIKNLELQLDRTRDLIDSRLLEISNMALRLSLDPMILDTIRITKPLTPDVFGKMHQMESRFHHFNQQTAFLHQIFIIFKRSDIIITDVGTSPDAGKYSENFFHYGHLDYEEWKEEIDIWSSKPTFLPADTIQTLENSVEAVTYRHPISISPSASVTAAFVALIPTERLDYFCGNLLATEGRITISDSQDTLLYTKNEVNSGSGLTQLRSRGKYIEISLTVPNSYVRSLTNNTRYAALTLLIVNLVMLVIVAVITARKKSLPLDSMAKKLGHYVSQDSHPEEDSYQWLNNALESILGKDSDTEATINMQWTRLRIGFYELLLRGAFIDDDEINEYLESINLPKLTGRFFAAIQTVIPGKEVIKADPTAQKMIQHTFISQNSLKDWHHHQSGLGEILVIPADMDYSNFLEENQFELFKSTGLNTLLCTGGPRETLLELKDSFEEAKRVLYTSQRNMSFPSHQGYTNYTALPQAYKYDDKDREKLVTAVYSGNPQNIAKQLDRIFGENYEKRVIPTTGRMRLFADLTTTVCDLVRKKGSALKSTPPNYNRYLELYSSQEDFQRRILELLVPITAYLKDGKKSHNSELLEKIIEYLKENYEDPMVCQNSVATRFELNPQYLSRFFKEQTGESFSRFLESLRMNKAVELICARDNKQTLKEIALESGYLSWNSFYKAFKRIYGVSPGEYKEFSRTG